MSTPWPDNVFDCAVRLARSLGYVASHIWPIDGRIYVYCPKGRGDWRELDPRDPTVWGALIGPHGVGSLFFWKSNYLSPGRYSDRTSYHPGLAVCEAYNALKGNPREAYLKINRGGADIPYSGPPEDRTKYDWIDAEMEKPEGECFVEVTYKTEFESGPVLWAHWVPANTVAVEHWDKNIVYSVLSYKPEGWYDLDGKPLTHKVTHWRYKKGRGKNEK